MKRLFTRLFGTKSSRRPERGRFRPGLESLENRLVPANLKALDLTLCDSQHNPIDNPALGALVYLRADFQVRGLQAGRSYTVDYVMDGVHHPRTLTATNVGLHTDYSDKFFVVRPGTTSASFALSGNFAEDDITDNVESVSFNPVAFTPKFTSPIGGNRDKDWAIWNYVDLDPDSDTPTHPHHSDYRHQPGAWNGGYTYDGHDALDLVLPNFAAMDRGVPVFAAAAGTVIETHNEEFDRHTDGPYLGAVGGNTITIDHGNGWQTIYAHLRLDSLRVMTGQHVAAGQQIALVGSAGNSSDAHLHFGVRHKGAVVETYIAPSAYWTNPWAYPTDVAPAAMASGCTDHDPTDAEMKELPPRHTVFTPTQAAYFWARLQGVHNGDQLKFVWSGPRAQTVVHRVTAGWDMNSDKVTDAFLPPLWVSTNPPQVAWSVDLYVNDVRLAGGSIVIRPAGAPEIAVADGSTVIINGRTTPIDFGSAYAAGSLATQTFTVKNTGTATLSLGNVSVPGGFVLDVPPPASLAPGAQATFKVRMTVNPPGPRAGNVVISSNAADDGTFAFAVSGARAWRSFDLLNVSQFAVANRPDGRQEAFALRDGTLWHRSQAVDHTWGYWDSLPGRQLAQFVVGRQKDGRLEAFGVDAHDGSLWHVGQTSASGPWGSWASLGVGAPGTLRQIALGRNEDGRLEIFAVGGNSQLWHLYQLAANGGWSTWEQLMGPTLQQLTVANAADGRLEVFAVGTDHALKHIRQAVRNGGWTAWESLGGWVSQVAVGLNGNGGLEVFAIGSDQTVWHRAQATQNGAWSAWESAGSGTVTQVAVGVGRDGGLQVVVLGTDGKVSRRTQAGRNGPWGLWVNLGGQGVWQNSTQSQLSQVALALTDQGDLEIFAVTVGGGVVHRF
jgi:hypothetical protein